MLAILGLRLLSRRSSLCHRATALPPHPSGASLFGTLTLLTAARAGSHLLPVATAQVAWRRLDLVVGGLFVSAGAYYLLLVATGRVTTILPGEAGGVLP